MTAKSIDLTQGRLSSPSTYWKRDLRYLVVPLLLMLVHLVTTTALHGQPDPFWPATGVPPVDAWGHLDSVWYVRIAQDGYTYSYQGASAWAFFPGFPLLMRLVVELTGLPAAVCGYVLAILFGLVAVLLFRRLAGRFLGSEGAHWATLAFSLYPYTVFLYGPVYSEPLALSLTFGAFLLMEQDRCLLAGLLAGGATFTRPLVLPIAVGLALRGYERLRGRRGFARFARPLGVAALASVGQMADMAYSWRLVRDPLAFLHAQSFAGWQGGSTFGRLVKTGYWKTSYSVVSGDTSQLKAWVFQSAGLVVFACALVLATRTTTPLARSLRVYAIACLLPIALGTSTFTSSGRYVLAAFPVFFILGSWLSRTSRKLATLALVCCALAQVLVGVALSRGLFVA